METYGKSSSTREDRVDYEYTAHVRAWETFANVMRRHGVNLRQGERQVTFRTGKLIDMKRLKENRLVWSYTVAKIVVDRVVLEKG
jgi:hypothetical protein